MGERRMIQTNRGPITPEEAQLLDDLHAIADGIVVQALELTRAQAGDFIERELADLAVMSKGWEAGSEDQAAVSRAGFSILALVRNRVSAQLDGDAAPDLVP